uniref:EB domain-containing protein n=1 Tax=Steinernema glaseri TaxID=37863 RepID=A0A1I7ZTL4_9BILA
MKLLLVVLVLSAVTIIPTYCENMNSASAFASVPLHSKCSELVVCPPPARCVSGICQCAYPYVSHEHRCILKEKEGDDGEGDVSVHDDAAVRGHSSSDLVIESKVLHEVLGLKRRQEPTIVSISRASDGAPTLQLYELKPIASVAVQESTNSSPPTSEPPLSRPASDSPVPRQQVVSQLPAEPIVTDIPATSVNLDRAPHEQPIYHTASFFYSLPDFVHYQQTVSSSLPYPADFATPQRETSEPPPFLHARDLYSPTTIAHPLSSPVHDSVFSQKLPHFIQPVSHPYIVQPTAGFRYIELTTTPSLGDPCGDAGLLCGGGSVCHMRECVCPQGFYPSETICKEAPRELNSLPPQEPLERPTPSLANPDDRCTVPCAGEAICVSGYCSCPQGTAYVPSTGCVLHSTVHLETVGSFPVGYTCTHPAQCGRGAFCGQGVCMCGLSYVQHGTTCVKRKHLRPRTSIIERGVEVNSASAGSSEN